MPNNKKKADDLSSMSQDRADMISSMMDKFEELINNYASQLTELMIDTFSDALSTTDGAILTDEQNMRKIALIDKAWNAFNTQQGMEIISTLINDSNDISAANLTYYRSLSDAQIRISDIQNIINSRLGIDDNGDLVKGGYMKGLLDDVSVRNQIKQYAVQKMASGVGYNDFNKGLKELIQGDNENLGAFQQFHRNFSFDVHAQVDRLNGALFAEKLNLKYFIYQGTRRKGSRYFCLQRKDKVFSSAEADEWKDLIGKYTTVDGEKKGTTRRVLIGPIVDDKATYNPMIDMGGYGCVDIPSFISEEIAFHLRPDLKQA